MKPKINQLINKSVIQLKRGSPTILTCLGVAGLVATTVSAVIATPKAIEKIKKDSLINQTHVDIARQKLLNLHGFIIFRQQLWGSQQSFVLLVQMY